ncbi:hypothetical protein ACQUW5_06185 [Legionella sp. CNM-1927-20]|uniref:hypothetical protein n=1 Tax=Legionella sp. CNM-1927-20 TaxID=3422221 RepID=UPI00403ACEE9
MFFKATRAISQQLNKNLTFSLARSYSNQSKAESIRVSAIDHDGCFGLPNILPADVATAHASTIEHLKNLDESRVHYVTSSSNRQSIRLDSINALYNQNNLAFPIARALAKTMGAWFDPLLLADINANRKPGFTINSAINNLLAKGVNPLIERVSDEDLTALINCSQSSFIFSEDKVNIVYAQMHRIALLHPKSPIQYNVYDDLHQQVLQPLSQFYNKYPMLIPKNVKLSIYYFNTACEVSRYERNLPSLFHTINGQGLIDSHYYTTVNAMGEIAKQEEGATLSKYYMHKYMTPSRIEAFGKSKENGQSKMIGKAVFFKKEGLLEKVETDILLNQSKIISLN